MNFINCTPHPIQLLDSDNNLMISLPKGEVIPRLSQSTKQVDVVNGISITETQFGETQDLPESQDGVLLLVLSANPNRTDLVVPNELVRDGSGNIIGCKSLARN